MEDLKQFNITFVGLKEGKHVFEYQIDKTFFEAYHFDEFLDSNVKIKLVLIKKSTLLDLNFTANGTVNIPCDTTNEPFNLKINTNLPLIVKFGQEFNDDNEDILIIPHQTYQINVAQYIYEMIVLAVPTKRIHPKVLDGTMESKALKRLRELEITKEKPTKVVDPRWNKLKDLLTEKKT